jgi:hypothetical protein
MNSISKSKNSVNTLLNKHLTRVYENSVILKVSRKKSTMWCANVQSVAYNRNHLKPILPRVGSGSSKLSLLTETEINKILTNAKVTHAAVCTPTVS